MEKIAIYPGTFDPITLGHVDLINRASSLFDKIIVAVADNRGKKPMFDLDERVTLCRDALKQFKNIEVCGFDCLLTDFANKHEATIMLRGLRAVSDFDYEFQLASMNRRLAPHIESIFLMPAENFNYLSSSLVREIASLGGDVQQFVPPVVFAALNKKLNKV